MPQRRAMMGTPLPARDERGEGWGEGLLCCSDRLASAVTGRDGAGTARANQHTSPEIGDEPPRPGGAPSVPGLGSFSEAQSASFVAPARKMAVARNGGAALFLPHKNDPGHPPVRVISLRMKPTNARSAEPSSGPGEPNPDDPNAPVNSGTNTAVIAEPGLASSLAPASGGAPGPGSEAAAIPPILLEDDDPEPAPANEEPKFAVGPTAGPAPTQPAPAELPQGYGTGRLLLMASDAGNLYAHWDLTDDQRTRFARLSADGLLRVRVRRESLGGPLENELPVGPHSDHSFIPVGAAGVPYVAELGYQPPAGDWRSIASSPPVVTPAEAAHQQRPIQFATLSFASASEPKPPVEQPSAPAKPAEPALQAPVAPPLERQFPLPPPLESRAAQASAWLVELPGNTEFEGAPPASFASGVAFTAQRVLGSELFPPLVPAQPGQWTEAQERALAQLIGFHGLRRQWVGIP